MFAAIFLLVAVSAQAQPAIRGRVVDISDAAIPSAVITAVLSNDEEVNVTVTQDGSFLVEGSVKHLRVTAEGFAPVDLDVVDTTGRLRVVLHPANFAESVVVTSARGAERLPSAASATVLTSAELAYAPAGALDDVLRQTPGFSLFRRSSSRVANPTTQGVTLRGVSGSGSSRTLVLADGVPLNDPFGSWVYWNRIPAAAVERVEIVRGAAGDLYGADALGGVIQILTFGTDRTRIRGTVEGGSHDTGRASFFGSGKFGPLVGSAAGEWLRTDGAITIGSELRGPIDVPADSDYSTGFVTAGTSREKWHASARFNAYTEHRGNGTPMQVNSTAWRQVGGEAGGEAGGGVWQARVSGGSQDYFQTFTAVAADRASERLTTEQFAPSDFFRASGQWTRAFGAHGVILGADTYRTESTVDEFRYTPTGVRQGPFEVGGSERAVAAFARVGIEAAESVTVGVGARVDGWRSEPQNPALDSQSKAFFSPRASLAWRVGDVSLQGSVYRAHRTPTLNELHRGFRAGNSLTNPNPLLKPEQLTGVDGGVLYASNQVSARATAFWNSLDQAIANITLSVTPTLITRERRNSDEIRAKGLELEADLHLNQVTVEGQVTFTSSRFEGSIAAPAVEGNRVPQVPKVQYAVGVTWSDPRIATAALQARGTSSAFDDDLNQLELGAFTVVDAMVNRSVTRFLQAFLAIENIGDREYDTGRTPLRTIGWPRTVRVGARFTLP
jgi:outer membrane receptor protein involved in Fe transport